MENLMESMFDYTPALAGKTAVVTGATSGIGLAAATLLAQHGARVIGIGRNAERSRSAEAFIHTAYPEAEISFLLADLSSQKQISQLAKEIQAELNRLELPCLDILVNNAGTYSQNKILTEDGIEKTFAINHLAPFQLTHLLVPVLQKSPAGRVITVSSDSHYNMTIDPATIYNPDIYIGLLAYAKSKLANVLFTSEFNRRYAGTRVHAFAVDPGLVKTDIALKGQPVFSRFIWKVRSSAGDDPAVPARTILYLAAEPSIQNSPDVYWCNSRPKRSSRQAARADLARDLWEISLKLCGISGIQLENK
jgi:NAD(P)-dependent dehydrogenase (short-subunit alcohol dehydrogenase family)